jgi:predicted enzyme related to lactoylglutathione lyase
MTGIVVRPVRFTSHLPEMQHFLELVGLRPWIVADGGGWRDMACGGGRVALHDAATSDSGGLPGQTTLAFEAADVTQLAKQLTSARVPGVTVYDEAYGRVLTCRDPDGATVAMDERATDLYGSEFRGERGAPESLRVMPVRFADPSGPYGAFLLALGLRPAGDINPYYVNFQADGGAHGQVGLHHVFSEELPIVPGDRSPAVQLTFQSAEPLERIADRLSAAGFEPGILVEDFGSLLHVRDPDGQEVQVHTEAAHAA